MSPLSRHTASAAWLGDTILAVIVPSYAATGITLIDLYRTILWIRAASTALLRRFAASLARHFAPFALVAHLMPHAAREGMALRIAAPVSAAAGLFELSYISIQAARGRHSHFNTATALEAVMAMLMGMARSWCWFLHL